MIKGFTLIETLVAIAILVTAIVGPLSISSSGLTASRYASEQTTAYYLAEEGIETLRSLRDRNSLNAALCAEGGWLKGVPKETGQCLDTDAARCAIDAQSLTLPIFPCTPGGTDPSTNCAVQKGSSGIFNQGKTGSDWATSQFTRTLQIKKITHTGEDCSPSEIRAIVDVSWKTRYGTSRTVTVAENLFDWK